MAESGYNITSLAVVINKACRCSCYLLH